MADASTPNTNVDVKKNEQTQNLSSDEDNKPQTKKIRVKVERGVCPRHQHQVKEMLWAHN
jgi:hypothetical protein